MSVVLLVPLVRCLGARELPIRLAGYCGPSDSAMRFSSPGVLQSSGASNSQQWRQLMPMSCERITVLLAKDVMKPVPPADMKAGFFSPYIIVPKKAEGYGQSWVCASWTGPFINLLSRCSRRTASSDASVPEIGLQWSTWRTSTSMCWSFRTTGQSCGLRSKDVYISTRSWPSAVPIALCLHESSGGSPCSLERTGRAHSQLLRRLAHTGSVPGSVMRTHGFGALALQPVGPSGQLGKEQTLPDAEDLFSRYGVRLGQSDSAPHARTCSVGA